MADKPRRIVEVLILLAASWLAWKNAPRSVACERLVGQNGALLSIDFEHLDKDDFREWVNDSLDIQSNYPPLDYEWEVGRDDYRALFDDNQMNSLQIRFGNSAPTGKDAIRCLGRPDYYRALYYNVTYQNELHVELWYMQQGVVVRYVDAEPPQRQSAPDPSESYPLSTITFTRWHEAEAMHRFSGAPLGLSLNRYPLQPWPASWDALEVTTDMTPYR